jgi:hypothetical protein
MQRMTHILSCIANSLSRLPLEEWRCTTKDCKSSILLHEEYPTKERYNAKSLKENVPRGSRGHFDICIWNPERKLCPFSSFSSSMERSASSNGWTLVEGFVKRYLVGAFIFADVLSVDSTPRSLFLLPQKA